MGSCNPKPQKSIPPQKESLQLCCKRLRYHLQIKQSKINQEIINGESQLVRIIVNSDKTQRNKVQQLLLAQRIVNGLKYTAGTFFFYRFIVYTLLTQYASSIGNFANLICENINDQQKIQPWQHKLYSIMYAAYKMPLNTLEEFKKCMNYFDNEILMEQHADQKVKDYLTPHPTPEEVNTYMLEMSQRNNLPLERINEAGHEFSHNFKPKKWDQEFQAKSNQFRDSLPMNAVGGKTNVVNHYQNGKNNARSSMSNPFDKGNLVEQKKPDPNAVNEIGTNFGNEKLDNNDVSPNITDLMKKIGTSKAPGFGE